LKSSQRPVLATAALGLSLAFSFAFTLTGCEKLGLAPSTASAASKPDTAFKGADITGADYAKTLSLPDSTGKQRTLADFKGKVTVVFFGYTQCPDVCPTTMAELAQVKKALGADGDKLQGVFVTIDPERDTPTILNSYVTAFDPSFVALRGSLEQTQEAAKQFKIFYEKVPGKTPGSYTMDHSAGSFVLDTKGQPRLFERYGQDADSLTADVKALLAQG
jgi:protein SCO1